MSQTTDSPWYDDVECIKCGEPLSEMQYPQDSAFVGESAHDLYQAVDHEVGHMCLACRESWDSHANSLTVVLPGGSTARARFDDGIMLDDHPYGEQGLSLDELPDDVYDAVEAIVEGTDWVPTSAWRGYTRVPDNPANFTTAKSGWHSTLTKTDASEVVNDILAGEYHGREPEALDLVDSSDESATDREQRSVALNVPVIGVFGTTSNVMSAGVDLYVPEGHADAIEQLFEGKSAGMDGSL